MGTIFIAGSYGVGKSTLCDNLSRVSGVPAYSAGDLISCINGEQYGANKVVQDKEANQDIFVKSLSKRLTLGYLWEHNIIAAPGGPRPFTSITDEQFDMIVKDSETEITYVE